MILIEDLEQMARIIAETEYKNIRILSASIVIPYDEWHQFEDVIHRYYQHRIIFIKEHRNIYSGRLDMAHYEVKFGLVTINCYRELPPQLEPKFSPRKTDRY